MIGLIIICVLIASFFILVITLLCKSYTKDIIELEERLLQLEKRINELENDNSYLNWVFDPVLHGLNITGESFSNPKKKVGEKEMACKKGRGGRKK